MVAPRKNTHTSKKRKGATVRDVKTFRFIKVMASHLKQSGKLFVPNCAEYIKTSHGREKAPENPDWYYIRCAAVLRRIYLRPGTGLGGLSKKFGSKKNRGSQPEITTRAATGPLHWACKSLEGLKYISKGKVSGRILTKEGRRVADTIAANIFFHRKADATKAARKAPAKKK